MNISQTLSKVPNYTSFYTVDELAAEGARLAAEYPSIITRTSIGSSRNGEPLWCLKLGTGDKNALCFACPHPNEPI